ncbi:MAG TPA: DNA repair protein RecN [Actinomycetota bacterium]|nr:DNA repair protein RecN [Actinomycetota bacterium]
MLIELDITNLAVIDHARIGFGPGLNVLTGETGAGKSIVIDALGLLVGDRADAGMVRAGTSGARVEGFFAASVLDLVDLIEEGLAAPEDEVLILGREITAAGRSVCRVNGRGVPVRMLQSLGERLVDLHGQSAHLSLLRVTEQADLLDRWANLGELRARIQGLRSTHRRIERELAELRGDDRELARRADLLRHQIGEIAQARLAAGEEEELRREQRLLANAEEILTLAAGAYEAVAGEEGSARDRGSAAVHLLGQLEGLDPGAAPLNSLATEIALQLEDLAERVRAYREAVEFDPGRLAHTDDRLAAIVALKRKYGASVEEVLRFGEGARAELADLEGRGGTIAGLEAEAVATRGQLAGAVAELNAGRREAARSLEQRVEEQFAALAMAGRFAVGFGEAASPIDAQPLEFLLSLNPGEPPRPLAKVASGGETSRVMLAVKAALAGAEGRPILVFDEIDSGIGGRVGETVGAKLRDLARHSQVLAVTHLPQLAAYGDVHLHVGKEVTDGRTVTRVTALTDEDRLNELSDMFGADREAGRLQAGAVLERARAGAPPR